MHGECVTVGNLYGYTDQQVERIKARISKNRADILPKDADHIIANMGRNRARKKVQHAARTLAGRAGRKGMRRQ